MTDRERYKRTFSKLHASEEILLEVNSMKKIKIMPIRRLAAIAAAAMLIAAMATVAYANDIGGIQETIQILLKDGTLLKVTDIREYKQEDGSTVKTAIFQVDEDGNAEAVHGQVTSMEAGESDLLVDTEVMASADVAEVEYKDDGTVWVHYNGEDIEITDLFEDGVCYLELENEQIDDETTRSVYLTIQYGEGAGYTSTDEFIASYSTTVDIQ